MLIFFLVINDKYRTNDWKKRTIILLFFFPVSSCSFKVSTVTYILYFWLFWWKIRVFLLKSQLTVKLSYIHSVYTCILELLKSVFVKKELDILSVCFTSSYKLSVKKTIYWSFLPFSIVWFLSKQFLDQKGLLPIARFTQIACTCSQNGRR